MKSNYRVLIALGTVFIVIFLLSFTFLNEVYLFGWAAHNWKFTFIIMLVPMLFFLFKKKFVSIFLSIGIVVGLFVGQYLGDYLRSQNIAKITSDMTAEQVYYHQRHMGFFIWMITIIACFVLGLVVEKISTLKSLGKS